MTNQQPADHSTADWSTADPIEYGQYQDSSGVNYWSLDRVLQRELDAVMDPDTLSWACPRLRSFGKQVGTIVAEHAPVIDEHGPELQTYDRRGEVINDVQYRPEQLENEQITYCDHGIVADSFTPPADRDDPLPLTHNLAMQYLLSYADPGFDCPVAMTAGVALVLEKFADVSPNSGRLWEYYDRLTSTAPDEQIEGAMYLTEKQGGSDVGANETTATYDDEAGVWRLTGEKWFCSNIDAEGTLALARTPGSPEGTDGLSMFLVPHTTENGALNEQVYRRLKDKLGTISVPTGEVELDGAEAYLVGTETEGFRQMAEMLNLERLSNAVASCGIMGRALLESKIHAANREAFGTALDDHPLMQVDLVDMAVDHEAATAFVFDAAAAFARREEAARDVRGDSDHTPGDPVDEEAYQLMRLLTPIAKARTARMAVDTASYAMEIRGGDGYVRDYVTHQLFRDAQVLPIWEGTENILSLDVLRALERERAHGPALARIDGRLEAVTDDRLADDVEVVRAASHDLGETLAALATADDEYAQRAAKELLQFIFETYTAALLLKRAQSGLDKGTAREAAVARRFIDRHLRNRTAGGIADDDRLPLDAFQAIVRFEPLDPERLRR